MPWPQTWSDVLICCGGLHMIRAFAPILARNGGGAILNVLSAAAWMTVDGNTSYAAAKSAEWGLTNGVRVEPAGQGTQVTALVPGLIATQTLLDYAAQAGEIEILDQIGLEAKAAALSGPPVAFQPQETTSPPGAQAVEQQVEGPVQRRALGAGAGDADQADQRAEDVGGLDVVAEGPGGGARAEEFADRGGEALLHLGADDGAVGEHRLQGLGHPLLALDPLGEAIHPASQRKVGGLGAEEGGGAGEEAVELGEVDRLDQVLAGREVAVEGADPDPRLPRDRLQADLLLGALEGSGRGDQQAKSPTCRSSPSAPPSASGARSSTSRW
jgi:hypothetical protein